VTIYKCPGLENCLLEQIQKDEKGRYVMVNEKRIGLPTEGQPSLIQNEGWLDGICVKELER
jgi:hypothetical protein